MAALCHVTTIDILVAGSTTHNIIYAFALLPVVPLVTYVSTLVLDAHALPTISLY